MGTYEAHGVYEGGERLRTRRNASIEVFVASPDPVGQGCPIGRVMKLGKGNSWLRPMALGHLARSGGGPNYDLGVLARSGSQHRKEGMKRRLARWNWGITPDQAQEQFSFWR